MPALRLEDLAGVAMASTPHGLRKPKVATRSVKPRDYMNPPGIVFRFPTFSDTQFHIIAYPTVKRQQSPHSNAESDSYEKDLSGDADVPDTERGLIRKDRTGSKACASCGTRKTPYWRDGWDSVVLCNACGIRFNKYRMKCAHCLYIPRKDERALSTCPRCDKAF